MVMKLRNICVALVASLAAALPLQARVEPATHNLISMLKGHGVDIHVNSSHCITYNIHGAYLTYANGSRAMVFCPGESWDAIDHSTVRHEMTHALQHCINIKRGTHRNTPILSRSKLRDLVNTYVPDTEVIFVKSSYPREKWLVEFEASYVERMMTSRQLIQLWNHHGCPEVFNVQASNTVHSSQ